MNQAVADDGLLVVGDPTLDENSREVTRAGEEIRRTAKEFELLRNPRRVLSKAPIPDRVWQYDFRGGATSSSSASPTCVARSTRATSRSSTPAAAPVMS